MVFRHSNIKISSKLDRTRILQNLKKNRKTVVKINYSRHFIKGFVSELTLNYSPMNPSTGVKISLINNSYRGGTEQ